MGARDLTADGKLIKNKKIKYEGKKAHAKDRTQVLTKLTAVFKFPRHPQKLVQNNNWCDMVIQVLIDSLQFPVK